MSLSGHKTKGKLKEVKAIIPKEVTEGLLEQNIKPVFENNEKVEESKNVIENRENTFSEKELKEFEKIRERLIYGAFGLSKKEYQELIDKFNKIQAGEGVASRKLGDIVRDKINVLNGQLGSNKKDSKEMAKTAVEWGVGVGAMYFSGIASAVSQAVASISTLFPYMGVVLGAVGLAWAYKKYKKASKGNISDASEKQRDCEDALKEVVEKINSFVSSIEQDKEMLLDKKNKLSKKEFNKFIDEYINSKCETFDVSDKKENIQELNPQLMQG